MKPPRKKLSPPTGYLPFPIVCNTGPAASAYCSSADQPFPSKIPKFEARFEENGAVLVSSPGDMALLYQMGFYGRGTLSKHEPIFHDVMEQPPEFISKHLRQISMERYLYCCNTDLNSKSRSFTQTSADNFSDIINKLSDKIELQDMNCDGDVDKSNIVAFLSDENDTNTNEISTVQYKSDSINYNESEEESCHDKEMIGRNFHSIHTSPRAKYSSSVDADFSCQVEPDNFSESLLLLSSNIDRLSDSEHSKCLDEWQNTSADEEFWNSDKLPVTQTLSEVTIDQKREREAVSYTLESLSRTDEARVTRKPMQVSGVKQSPKKALSSTISDSPSDQESSDDDYPLFKDADTKSDEGDKCSYFDLKEKLLLDPCEVIFLMLSFNCLVVTDCAGESVTLQQLWQNYIACDVSFPPKYAVYHHIRTKGWVPKDGLTYGCDFMVYKKGPKYYHSSLGVVVRCCESGTLKETDYLNSRHLSWAKIMGLNRVINNVRKQLMICYVILPQNQPKDHVYDLQNFLRNACICETLISRIVPSREREPS